MYQPLLHTETGEDRYVPSRTFRVLIIVLIVITFINLIFCWMFKSNGVGYLCLILNFAIMFGAFVQLDTMGKLLNR